MSKVICFVPNIAATMFKATIYENDGGVLSDPVHGPWLTADQIPLFMAGYNDAKEDYQRDEVFQDGRDFYESNA